jgi:DNA-binding beta-propeller fold protein YncE
MPNSAWRFPGELQQPSTGYLSTLPWVAQWRQMTQCAFVAAASLIALPEAGAATWGRQFAFVVQEDVMLAKDYIARVNVATGEVERRYDLGSRHFEFRSVAASTAAQRVFFVDAWNAQLVSLNIHSGVMSRTFAGNVPEGVTVSPDGERAYVALSFENAVSEFDAKSITSGALRTIPVGSRPVGLAMNPRGNRLYVTNALGHSVTCIDLSASPVATYSVSLINAAHPTPRPLGIATNASGTRAYVSLGASNANIAVLDITELQPRFIADIPTESSSMSLGDTRLGIATNPAADLFYAVAPGRDRLTFFTLDVTPPGTGPFEATYAAGYPVGISVDGTGNRVLVQGDGTSLGDPNNARLYVYEARTGEPQWTLRIGRGRALVGNAILEDDVLFRSSLEP